jgi:hypothetical protein
VLDSVERVTKGTIARVLLKLGHQPLHRSIGLLLLRGLLGGIILCPCKGRLSRRATCLFKRFLSPAHSCVGTAAPAVLVHGGLVNFMSAATRLVKKHYRRARRHLRHSTRTSCSRGRLMCSSGRIRAPYVQKWSF